MIGNCKCGCEYTASTLNFGHDIYWCQDCYKWYFENGKEVTTGELGAIKDNLICPKCKMKPAENGHDPCIVNLPNVKDACCGHGDSHYAYVALDRKSVV